MKPLQSRTAAFRTGALGLACALAAFGAGIERTPDGLSLTLGAGAQAQTAGAPMSIDSFYDELSPYGVWIESPAHGYVWIPSGVAEDWRPYTVGQWVWTDEFGWYWESDEPFGWATFHYGRWGYSDDLGWYWVPGDEWAPAWVTWRDDEQDDVVGWAPVAPPAQGYAWGPPPAVQEVPIAQSWVFVPTVQFVQPRVYQYAYPIAQTNIYIGRTPRRWYIEPGRPYWNRPFGRERIIRVMPGRPIPVRRVTIVDRPWAGGVRPRDSLIVYRPRIDNRRPAVQRRPARTVETLDRKQQVRIDNRQQQQRQDLRQQQQTQQQRQEEKQRQERQELKQKQERQAEKQQQERQELNQQKRQQEQRQQQRQQELREEQRRQEQQQENRQQQQRKELRQQQEKKNLSEEQQKKQRQELRQQQQTQQQRQEQKQQQERQQQKAQQERKQQQLDAERKQKKQQQENLQQKQQKQKQEQRQQQQKKQQNQEQNQKQQRQEQKQQQKKKCENNPNAC